MSYEDRITIATPEGVDLEITLAGLGSRFAAALLDGMIKFVVILGALAGLGALGASLQEGRAPQDAGAAVVVGLAIFFVFVFAVNFAYDVLFETLSSGRTPGKRWTGLRVVRDDGRPVAFTTSSVRNLLRLVDGLPFAYAVGIVSILVTDKNQRLGDLAAGTIVVRELKHVGLTWTELGRSYPPEALETWDVSAISVDELVTVRRFLDRRGELTPEARGRLAQDFATRLAPKVAGAPQGLQAESFLEQMVAAKGARS